MIPENESLSGGRMIQQQPWTFQNQWNEVTQSRMKKSFWGFFLFIREITKALFVICQSWRHKPWMNKPCFTLEQSRRPIKYNGKSTRNVFITEPSDLIVRRWQWSMSFWGHDCRISASVSSSQQEDVSTIPSQPQDKYHSKFNDGDT